MKIIKTILAFIVALLVLSSCAVKQNGSSDSNSESSDFIGQTAVMDEAYKELTKDTKTITVDGVLYRNKFQGDLILRNPKYGAEPVLSDSTGQYYRLEGTDHDLIYNASGVNKGTSENIYCRDIQWSELNSYYSTSSHFVYRCVVRTTGSAAQTVDVDKMDTVKLNELVRFCETNAYKSNDFADSDSIKSVPSASLGDKTYRFVMSSNDGLFSANAREFCVLDGSLVYKYREVMSEEKTLIIDVPEELSKYFLSIINGLSVAK
ncbi:MAG: hypothetical protein IKK09_02410 [Clostridia bacterium]|nr:hypothetical protein [Clostridia bacterium]